MRALAALLLLSLSTSAWAGKTPFERRVHAESVRGGALPEAAADDDPSTQVTTSQLDVWLDFDGRVSNLRLRVLLGGKVPARDELEISVTGTTDDNGATPPVAREVTQPGWLEVPIPHRGWLGGVTLTFSRPTTVRDIEVYATSSEPQAAAHEKAKLSALRQHREARLRHGDGALSGRFQVEEHRLPQVGDPWEHCKSNELCTLRYAVQLARGVDGMGLTPAELALAREVANATLAGWEPVEVTVLDSRPLARPDESLSVITPFFEQEGMFDRERFSTAPRRDDLGLQRALSRRIEGCRTRVWAKVAAGKVRALAVARCELLMGRGGRFADADLQLLVYDDQGQLTLATSRLGVTRYRWSGEQSARPARPARAAR